MPHDPLMPAARRRPPLPRRLAGVAAALALAAGPTLLGVGPAAADVVTATAAAVTAPPEPFADFTADACPGSTVMDPTTSGIAGTEVKNLLRVTGGRLDAYNAGAVVPLYDSMGRADEHAYPPLCGTRYVEGAGGEQSAVSEWMFCTDMYSLTCGSVDADGNLVDSDGKVLEPLSEMPGNPRLDADEERLIAYLIENGHSYEATGSYDYGTTTAAADIDRASRVALQALVWCISDVAPSNDGGAFAAMCEQNLPEEERARLLASSPKSQRSCSPSTPQGRPSPSARPPRSVSRPTSTSVRSRSAPRPQVRSTCAPTTPTRPGSPGPSSPSWHLARTVRTPHGSSSARQ